MILSTFEIPVMGAKRLMILPSRLMKNFVKFHLIDFDLKRPGALDFK